MERVFIIGYIGSDRETIAKKEALRLGCDIMYLDKEIARLEQRSIPRMVMIAGEHHYRNDEYEILSRLMDPEYPLGIAKAVAYPEKLVIVCGDGVVLDDDSFEILKSGNTIFAEEDPEALWEKAKLLEDVPYAFMMSDDDAFKKKKFIENYELRLPRYREASSWAASK